MPRVQEHVGGDGTQIVRIALKKQFLDSLSSVICHHSVLDFIYLGIPNRRLEQLQVAQAPLIPAAMPMSVV